MKGGIAAMLHTPFDPMDLASLALWQQADADDNRQQIQRLLRNLPLAIEQELTEHQRKVLRMRFSQNMTVTAIALELGLNKSTVSRTLARCTEKLYRSLRYSL